MTDQEAEDKPLSLKLQEKGAAIKPTSFGATMKLWYQKTAPSLSALCGSETESKKLYVAAIGHITRSPELMQCTTESLQQCIMLSATTKLYPGPYQECAYVRYGNKAEFQPQYQGLIKLATRGGIARGFSANVVYEADTFDYEEGTHAKLSYKKFLGKDRGQRVCVYALARLDNGETAFIIVSIDEIESIKKRSKAATSKHSPWNTEDEDEMWKKTALKKLCKLLPKGTEATEFIKTVEIDNTSERPDLSKTPIMSFEDNSELVGVVKIPQN